MTTQQEERLLEDVALMKMALLGEKKLEQPGLMVRVHRLEKWRRSIDVRIAGVSGMVVACVGLFKWLFNKG